MKATPPGRLERAAAPIEYSPALCSYVKRGDLMPPLPVPEGQPAPPPGALAEWIAQEVILTFEQADRRTFDLLRTATWVMGIDKPELILGVLAGLTACLDRHFCLLVVGDPRAYLAARDGLTLRGETVLWEAGK